MASSTASPLMCLEELKKLKNELILLREDVLLKMANGDGPETMPVASVKIWLSDVLIKVAEVDQLINYVVESMSTHVNSFGEMVAKMQSELVALKSRAPLPSNFTTEVIENKLEEVIKCLLEDMVGVIGIWGMGGIGKTTLMTRLNNKCLSHFDSVIWLQVSSEKKVEELQDEIVKQIRGLSFQCKEKDFNDKAALISQLLSEKKILVLVDDLWNLVELKLIGIPHNNKCQVVFTTRSKTVCGLMKAQRIIKLEPLGWEKAWRFFQNRIRIETLAAGPDIETIAREVVRECRGVPLLLATCAQALCSKTTLQEWKHFVEILRKSASRDVFSVLKYSYDCLPDQLKSCLLYCALFPRNFDIPKEELIDKWICEGFLDDDEADPFIKGYNIIETLVNLSLLEDKYEVEAVRMHDLIRDMCLWIACEVEKEKENYFVQAGTQLRKAPPMGGWRDARRISLILNKTSLIQRWAEVPASPHLSTLLLSRNPELEEKIIVDGFLRYKKKLKVLDLLETGLRVLPIEISGLISLQYLDISHTKVETLPPEVMKLERLVCFNLEYTSKLRDIPTRMIASLKLLQVFRTIGSNLILSSFCVEELERLESLKALSITIRDANIYHNVLSGSKLSKCIQSLFVQDLELPYGEFLGTKTKTAYCFWETRCLDSLRRVNISCCHFLQDLTWVIHAPNLSKLIVRYCENLEDLSCAANEDLELNPFAKLQELELIGLPKLKSICKKAMLFPLLNVIRVCGCPMLKKLPLNTNSAKGRRLVIEGTLDWWCGLEWEDQATQTAFRSCFEEIIWFNRRDGTCTSDDRNRRMQHRLHRLLEIVDHSSENTRNTRIGFEGNPSNS